MNIDDVTEKRENSLEVFSTLIMIAGVIGLIAGIMVAINLQDFIFAVYGISGFLSTYLIYTSLMTLAENHCMLRHITKGNIEKNQSK